MDIDMDTDLIAQQLRAIGIEIRSYRQEGALFKFYAAFSDDSPQEMSEKIALAFSAGALSLAPSQVVCTGAENWA